MKKIFAVATFAAGLILSGQALAHGAKPRHGGIVQTAGDLTFELVARDGGATIYVDNTLIVKGEAALEKGSKAVASVSFADKKNVSVRFSVK